MTLYADVQYPHRVRNMLAQSVFRIPEGELRVIAQDVGGAFGTKGWQYVEHRLVLWAARKLRRPVKWSCERSEAVMADEHGRDNIGDIELALDADNRFIGLRLNMLANIGAYVGSDRNLLTPFGQIWTVCGVYAIPAAYVHITGLLSNTNPTAPYRGAGRPEAIYLIERLVDDAARELGVDRVALRRKNMLPTTALPYQSPLGAAYDCGDFEKNLDLAIELADVQGFAARREASRRAGRLRGLGIINAIEQAGGTAQPEYAEIRFNPAGSAMMLMGTKAQGQGHETMYKQILNERLGLDPKDVKFIDGDTDRVAFGMGTMGSRSMVLGGSALCLAADKVIAKGKRIAAHLLEAGNEDIEFADGTFRVAGTDRTVSIKQVAVAAFQPARLPPGTEVGLFENATFVGSKETWPNGCHVCEVEVDPDTGGISIERYTIVDDFGRAMNPRLLEGQVHGGTVQGIGQALLEHAVYDAEGQLLTGSYMDYAMPRANDLPSFDCGFHNVPCTGNPLGVKGAGEAGAVGAPAAVINAIVDALHIRHVDMPATPERIWRALKSASGGA
jgi:carbon-monoxide dehydrogenase large subunit